jgi:hypothetical protein
MGLHHLNSPLKIRGQVLPPGSTGLWYFFTSYFFISSLIINSPLSIIHYTITPPCLRRYPSYLKRGVIMGLHHLNSPLKIRGQVLPPGSTGVMIFPTSNFFPSFLNSQLSIIHSQLIYVHPCKLVHNQDLLINFTKSKSFFRFLKFNSDIY